MNAINIAPITPCEKINDVSELSVLVEGRPPKYAAKKIPQNTIPIPWVINRKILVCLVIDLINSNQEIVR